MVPCNIAVEGIHITRSAALIDWHFDNYFEELDEDYTFDRTVYGYRSCAFRIEFGVKVDPFTRVPLNEVDEEFYYDWFDSTPACEDALTDVLMDFKVQRIRKGFSECGNKARRKHGSLSEESFYDLRVRNRTSVRDRRQFRTNPSTLLREFKAEALAKELADDREEIHQPVEEDGLAEWERELLSGTQPVSTDTADVMNDEFIVNGVPFDEINQHYENLLAA